MEALVLTNDLVRLSFLVALLADGGIAAEILDQAASSMDGSIGAVPRRLVVAGGDAPAAKRILQEAGEL